MRNQQQQDVDDIYRCDLCGKEVEVPSVYDLGNDRCMCGGTFRKVGHSYPADRR